MSHGNIFYFSDHSTRGVASDFEGVSTRKVLTLRSRKCHFVPFSENVVRGERVHLFVFHYTITFLPISLWNNKRIKETLTQRHQSNAKKISVIPVQWQKYLKEIKNVFFQFSALRAGVCAYMDAKLLLTEKMHELTSQMVVKMKISMKKIKKENK